MRLSRSINKLTLSLRCLVLFQIFISKAMVCGVLYGCFGLLLHKHGCYFQNFILFQIDILLYNIILQNTLDQLAVGSCYKCVCYSFARKYMG